MSCPVALFAFADARTDTSASLRADLDRERRETLEIFAEAERAGVCQPELLLDATSQDVVRTFHNPALRDRIAIFHFAGHADSEKLLFESGDGGATAAAGCDLADFFGHQAGLTLVFLNGCSTEGHVEALLAAGVPAVISTSRKVDSLAAAEFAINFYRILVHGQRSLFESFEEAQASVRLINGGRVRGLSVEASHSGESPACFWSLCFRPDAESTRHWKLISAHIPGLPPLGVSSRPPTPAEARASIAVLPFQSLSADPEDGYIATGIASEIIVALGGVPDLRVAPEIASFRFRGEDADLTEVAGKLRTRYLLTGSFRRAGDRIRVLVTLTDTAAANQIWSKAYNRRLVDLFDLQEEIAREIVGSTGGEIIRASSDRAIDATPEHLDAWGLLRRAYHFWNHRFSMDGLEQALLQVRRALELNPSYGAAHAFLGLYHIQRAIHGLTTDIEEERRLALASADNAINLSPRDSQALENAGLVFYHTAQPARAVATLRRAVETAPFNLVAWGYLALTLGVAGADSEVTEARRILDRLIETAPEHPSLPYWYYFKGAVEAREGNLAESAACAQHTLELQPHFFLAAVMLSNALGTLGFKEEACAAWRHVTAVHPGFLAHNYAVDLLLQAPTPAQAEPHLAGLRLTGILV